VGDIFDTTCRSLGVQFLILRTDIQDKIVEILDQQIFDVVEYSASEYSEPELSGTKVAPSVIEVNETGCSFDLDRNSSRTLSQVRSGWKFAAYIEFAQEVLLDPACDVFLNKVQFVEESGEFASVMLLNYLVAHPTRASNQGATAAVFMFEVNPVK